MPFFTVAVQVELTIKADSPQDAHAAFTEWQPPPDSRIDNIDVISIKRKLQADKRLITHLPNVPRQQLINAMLRLTETQRTILSLCAKPQHMPMLFECCQRIDGTISTTRFAKEVVELKNGGWLSSVEHNIELDSFPDFHGNNIVRAQFTNLARGNGR